MFPSADAWPHNTSRCPHGRQPASPGRPWDVADDLPDAPLAERFSHLYECEQLSTYQVAQIAGIDRQRVGRMLRAAGVAVKPRGAGRKRQADSRADVVAELYLRQELTSTEVSARTGIPSRTIRGWLAARQAPMRTRGWANREDRLAALAGELGELYVDGGLSDLGALPVPAQRRPAVCGGAVRRLRGRSPAYRTAHRRPGRNAAGPADRAGHTATPPRWPIAVPAPLVPPHASAASGGPGGQPFRLVDSEYPVTVKSSGAPPVEAISQPKLICFIVSELLR
jgi:hypothetical protein